MCRCLWTAESWQDFVDDTLLSGSDKLENEFQELYTALFKKKEAYMRIVKALATRKAGMSRDELSKVAKVTNSGTLTKHLSELEQFGFIMKYVVPTAKVKGAVYQLMDNFTLFHFRFIANNPTLDRHFWSSSVDAPFHRVFGGLAFGRLCLWHR